MVAETPAAEEEEKDQAGEIDLGCYGRPFILRENTLLLHDPESIRSNSN